jgi:PAS domain S-box-containing protein
MNTPPDNIERPVRHAYVQCLQLLDELGVGALIIDNQRRIAAMNLNAQSLMGVREDEALGKACREVFCGVPCLSSCLFRDAGPDDAAGRAQGFWDEYDEAQLVRRMALPVYDEHGAIAGCLTVLQDQKPIADLIARIHHEERSLKIILDHLDTGIFTVNLDGYITFFNREAEKLSGYNRQEVLGKPCSIVFRDEAAQGLCRLNETITSGLPRSTQRGRLITRDGDLLPIRAHFMGLRNEKRTIVGGLITFQDLTLVRQLHQAISDRYTFKDMIGRSPAMQRVFEMARIVAATEATVLIEAPTGCGKDLLAKAIHWASPRAEKPFVKVNCAAIPENLLESEMFGYVKGAFTGAETNKPGRFREAHGGSLFLDEVGDLSLALQAKLLRVIEDREFYPLGGRQTVKVDVRLIAATNRGLASLVNQRLFREDLYYRLNVFRIELPALKERRVDLPLLIQHIFRRLVAVRDRQPLGIAPETMKVLLNYCYPGNIRELENILEHALIVCRDDYLQPQDLPDYLRRQFGGGRRPAAPVPLPAVPAPGHQRLLLALEQCGGNRTQAARLLGIHRSTLWRQLQRLAPV